MIRPARKIGGAPGGNRERQLWDDVAVETLVSEVLPPLVLVAPELLAL